jgi:5-methyltetrahydrofolate--homocysteine methyltransferase
MDELKELAEAIINGDEEKAKELTQKALKKEIDPQEILSKGLIPGMDIVGKRFKEGKYFLPEVLVAAEAMKASLEWLRPLLTKRKGTFKGKVVIGTIEGDLHDIGKNLVGMMLEGAGFEVIDLGADVPLERWVQAVKTQKPDVLGMSALLTTTMLRMKDVIEELTKAKLRSKIVIMVGGAPITQSYAEQIGADGYAPDAASAVDKVKEFALSRFSRCQDLKCTRVGLVTCSYLYGQH